MLWLGQVGVWMVGSAELHRFTLAAIAVDGGDGIEVCAVVTAYRQLRPGEAAGYQVAAVGDVDGRLLARIHIIHNIGAASRVGPPMPA